MRRILRPASGPLKFGLPLLLALAAVGVAALIPVILKPLARKRGVRNGSPTDAS